MIHRNLDSSGDWTFGHGRQDMLRDADAIAMNLKTRLRFFRGDCFWRMDFGVDWWNLLGVKSSAAAGNIVLQCRAMIATSYGVVRIDRVSSSTNAQTRALSVQYDVDTVFSRRIRNAVVI